MEGGILVDNMLDYQSRDPRLSRHSLGRDVNLGPSQYDLTVDGMFTNSLSHNLARLLGHQPFHIVVLFSAAIVELLNSIQQWSTAS